MKSDGEGFIEYISWYNFMRFFFKMGSSQTRHGNVHILYRFVASSYAVEGAPEVQNVSRLVPLHLVIWPISEILCCLNDRVRKPSSS
jgi:hypothetical protein